MAGFVAIFLLLLIVVVIGSILGWIAFNRTANTERTVVRLEKRLIDLENRVERLKAGLIRPESERAPVESPTQAAARSSTAAAAPPERPAVSPVTPSVSPATAAASRIPPAEKRRPEFLDRLVDNMRRNWMAWLGGISVALAGIFLVGYSIEMGYLGPRARILLAVVVGLALHSAAEYFRRRTQTAHPAFAAMAGGASITLYAAIVAAVDLYGLLTPGASFVLLAVVSLVTVALATVHGPLLAALGLLGAYIVPLLVIDNVEIGVYGYLGYSFIVTAAGLLLIHFVYRLWLWLGTLGGALFWWLEAVASPAPDYGALGYYLAAVTYLALAVPTADWTLTRRPHAGDPATETLDREARLPVVLLTVIAIALAHAISIVDVGFTSFGTALLWWSPFTLVVLWAARSRDSLVLAPWAMLLLQLGAWFVGALDSSGERIPLVGLRESGDSGFLIYAIATSVLFSAGTALANRDRAPDHLRSLLCWLSPVLWLALAYLLVTDLSARWEWAVATVILGLVFTWVGGRKLASDARDSHAAWPITAGHFAYSVAAAMFFREGTLSLALAAQLVSLAWLHRRFGLTAFEYLIKGVLALVVLRLTLNPWLLTYPSDVHWSLWTYGGAVLCCFIATRLADEKLQIRKWLEATTLHLFVLFLGAETRYWLYDGDVFAAEVTLTEAAIDTALWGALGITYFRRSLHSTHLAGLYVILSRVLMVLALGSYAFALTELNPLFSEVPISATPILNILLLAYGAPVLIATAAWFYYEARFKDIAASIAALALFIFVTIEIRHLWHGALSADLAATSGEIYTYSAAWLVLAVVTMLTATALGSRKGYRAGMALLLFVIAKIFLYDMSGLEGLLRVGSFFGLGLALLGLAWLYQRTSRRPPAAEA